jgi:hypothetical protein
MSISKVIVESCAGGSIEQIVEVMINIAERHACEVECIFNGTKIVVGPSRVCDITQIWYLKRLLGQNA